MTRTQMILNQPAWKTIPVLENQGTGMTYKTIHRLQCHRCLKSIDLRGPGNLPWEVIVRKFRERGWEVDPKRPQRCFCPDHKKVFNPVLPPLRDLVPPHQPVEFVDPHTEKAPPMPDVTQATNGKTMSAPAGDASLSPLQMRKVISLLDAQFDEEKGRYRPGYSDAAVAAEAHTSEAAVFAVRQEAYGALQFDPLEEAAKRLSDLDNEYRSLGDLLTEMRRKLGALRST